MKRRVKVVFIVSLLVNVLLVGFWVGKRLYFSSQGNDHSFNYNDITISGKGAVLSSLPIDTADIVFVGNSLTERCPLTELFPGVKIKNRGVGSSETRHLINWIQGIALAHPKKIFIESGINDLANKVSIDSIMINCKAVISIIKKRSPGTKVYVQSLFPAGIREAYLQTGIKDCNERLSKLCLEMGVEFVNVFKALEKDGKLPDDYTYDGCHLTYAGYMKWKEYVSSFL